MSLALALTAIVLTQTYRPSQPVEVYIAPIIAPSNIIGMGGAAQALATGSGAILQNPAAMAVRYDYNGVRYFDWDFSFDYLISAGHNDIENSGQSTAGQNLTVLEGSLGFNLGKLGLGVAVDSQSTRACPPGQSTCGNADALNVTTTLLAVSGSYAFLNGEVVAGVSYIAPIAKFQFGNTSDSPTYNGSALAVGVVVAPHDHRMRFGATARLRVDASRSDGDSTAQIGELFIPDRLEAPWQIAVGGAYSFGEKPLNLRNAYGQSELQAETVDPTKRYYIVVAADLVVIGPSNGAAGRNAWLRGDAQSAGDRAGVSPRLGVESEFIEDLLRGRAGTYWEPSRFEATDGRLHATAGFDLRLLQLIWVWRLTGAVDFARDYHNFGVSLGFWH